jgi:AcrR family transcriptional regulator
VGDHLREQGIELRPDLAAITDPGVDPYPGRLLVAAHPPEAETLLRTDEPPEVQLRALVRLWVARVIEHRDHMLVFQQERHVIDHGERWRAVRDSRKRFERLVARVLHQAHDAGLTRPKDPRLTLSALLGMVNHTAQRHRPRGRLTPTEIADAYVDLILTTR